MSTSNLSPSNPQAARFAGGVADGGMPKFEVCFRVREQQGWDLWDDGQHVSAAPAEPLHQRFFTQTHHLTQVLQQQARQYVPATRPLRVILRHRDPLTLLSYLAAACLAQAHVYLANPQWTDREWQTVLTQIQPDAIATDLDPVTGLTWLSIPESSLSCLLSPPPRTPHHDSHWWLIGTHSLCDASLVRIGRSGGGFAAPLCQF